MCYTCVKILALAGPSTGSWFFQHVGGKCTGHRATSNDEAICYGGPWMLSCSGGCSEAKEWEWKLQVETIFSFQPLTDSKKADFVLGLLEGKANREIITLKSSS